MAKAKVGKSDYEGTFAGTQGNDEDAPKLAISRGIQQASEFEPQFGGGARAKITKQSRFHRDLPQAGTFDRRCWIVRQKSAISFRVTAAGGRDTG
jgi:hypothetical protein